MSQSPDLPATPPQEPEFTPSVAVTASPDPVVYSTETEPPSPAGQGDSASGDSTAQAAKDEASQVADTAKDAAAHVAEVGKEQTSQVAREASRQAKDLFAQGREELRDQASTQQQRLSETLRTLANELHSMASRSTEQGTATGLVTQAGEQTIKAADWLDGGDPDQLLADVRRFARQRPAAFLGLAAAAGILVGRLGRGLKDGPTEPTEGGAS